MEQQISSDIKEAHGVKAEGQDSLTGRFFNEGYRCTLGVLKYDIHRDEWIYVDRLGTQ